MKKLLILLTLISLPLFAFSQVEWTDLAVTEDQEIYVDPASINEIDGRIYATIKTIYMTPDAREIYVDKIKRAFKPKDADKKTAKWQDFSYTITSGVYDCENKRFKIIQIEDFRSDGSRIVRTKTKENKARWLLVDIDTVGDHILFYICDFENR